MSKNFSGFELSSEKARRSLNELCLRFLRAEIPRIFGIGQCGYATYHIALGKYRHGAGNKPALAFIC